MTKKEVSIDAIEAEIEKLGGIEVVNGEEADKLWDVIGKNLGLKSGKKLRAVYQQAKTDESDEKEDEEEESSKQEESAPEKEKEDKKEEEDDNDQDEDEYEVEEIVDSKKKGSSIEYLVKWRGYPSDQNTWEPAENLHHCEDMIQAFNQKNQSSKTRKTKKPSPPQKRQKRDPSPAISPPQSPIPSPPASPKKESVLFPPNPGFQHGHQIEKIWGITKKQGKVYCWCTWKNQGDVATMVKSSELAEKEPLMLLQFYEAHIKFEDMQLA